MDKRKIFVPALFLLAVSGASAWEETNPNAVRVDRKEIKVEKALQGVYLKTELLQCFSNSVSLNMGYFREDRLAPTFTLRTLAGLCHYVYWVHRGVDQFGQEYIDYEGDDNIIAYGELPSGAATSGDGYTEFTIPLKYKESQFGEQPTHIIIVCSASKYGDYMTGGDNSLLYVDDFSLVYEGTPTIWENK